jgi:hypothetical protein
MSGVVRSIMYQAWHNPAVMRTFPKQALGL